MTNLRANPKNWDPDERWHRVGNRVAWWDNRSKNWIAYDVDEDGHQIGSADFYGHISHLLESEPQFA